MNTEPQASPQSRGLAIPVLRNQPLFDHMIDAHGITLVESEMDELLRVAESVRPACAWHYDDFHSKWDTDCENGFYFESGSPEENGFKNCPYCGKRIK